MSYSAIQQDPRYLEKRVKEYKDAIQPYYKEIGRLYCLFPPAGFRLDMQTGEMETLPLLPKYQNAIDRILWAKQEMIKECFPEFYNPEYDVILPND